MHDTDKERLKEFQQKMHDEGADGFADGPCPWDAWDESGAQAGGNKRAVWNTKARTIYKHKPASLGDRFLSGLAKLALAAMAVGIAGVYFTKDESATVARTAVQPTPIPLPWQHDTKESQKPAARAALSAPKIMAIDSLPPPAAGPEIVGVETPVAEADATDEMRTPAATYMAGAPGVAHPEEPVAEIETSAPAPETNANAQDIEIVAAPTALLLTNAPSSAQLRADSAPALDSETELAMEIATAPALDDDMEEASPTAGADTWDTGSANPFLAMAEPEVHEVEATPPAEHAPTGDESVTPAGQPGTPEETSTETPASMEAQITGESDPGKTTAEAAIGTTADNGGTPIPEGGVRNTAREAARTEAVTVEVVPENLPPPAAGKTARGRISREVEVQTAVIQPEAAAPAEPTDSQEISQESDSREDSEPAVPDTPAEEQDSPGNDSLTAIDAQPPTSVTKPAAAAAAPVGGWVVNLASYNFKSMARKKLEEFQSRGVDAEIQTVDMNDRTIYRIRVTGFENSRTARANISSLEKTLGLKGVWISRR